MLIAERRTQVFARTDGGDGKESGEGLGKKANAAAPDTPERIWNMLLPILILVILIIYLLVESGEDEDLEQTLIDKLQNSSSYSALLYGSMAAAMLTILVYHFQFKQEGDEGGVLLWPTPKVLGDYAKGMWKNTKKNKKDDDEEEDAPLIKPIMTVNESINSFLYGMGHVFPALIVLTLAWAGGSIMGAVGTDRLFAAWISGGLAPELLPTLSFLISFFMALATGTSWGTMVSHAIRMRSVLDARLLLY
jgi:Na+/H+ antiporter NhaC